MPHSISDVQGRYHQIPKFRHHFSWTLDASPLNTSYNDAAFISGLSVLIFFILFGDRILYH